MAKSNVRKIIIASFLFFAFLATLSCAYLYFFYSPREERQFLVSAENLFHKSNLKSVAIEQLTDFDWDVVCALPKNAYFKIEGEDRKQRYLGKKYFQANINIPNVNAFNYYWGLVFRNSEVPVKILEFKRFSKLSMLGESYYIGKVRYGTSSKEADGTHGCFNKNNAYLYIDNKSGYLYLGGKNG